MKTKILYAHKLFGPLETLVMVNVQPCVDISEKPETILVNTLVYKCTTTIDSYVCDHSEMAVTTMGYPVTNIRFTVNGNTYMALTDSTRFVEEHKHYLDEMIPLKICFRYFDFNAIDDGDEDVKLVEIMSIEVIDNEE